MTRLLMVNVTAGPTYPTRRRLRRRGSVPASTPPQIAQTVDGDPPQDEATYRCGCGYVFGAAVSTSVACPYCGDAQAW
jgi:hypothetical protein